MRASDLVADELKPFLESIPEEFAVISRKNLRRVRELSEANLDERPAGGNIRGEKLTIQTTDGPLDLYVYRSNPNEANQPCLLWLHGGGYIMGRGEDNWFGPKFAEGADCTVVSVGYRHAPEHPFPAGMEDSYAALNWIAENTEQLSIDKDRIAIGGASAGGGLAAGLALLNRDRGGPDILFQLLLCPMIDNLHDTESGQITDHPIWNQRTSFNAWEMYLNGEPGLAASKYAAPTRATDLSNLPPAFVPVGSVDLFLDENRDYVQRLNDAGVQAKLRVYPGVYHGGEISGAETDIAKNMSGEYIEALANAFNSRNSMP